jgi:ankyrin repeat protein
MLAITRCLLLLIFAFLLAACTGKEGIFPFYIYILSGGGQDTCKESHPVQAYLSGCSRYQTKNPSPLVTKDNANDKVGKTCLLELAASYGNLDVFRQLLDNGADIHRCASWRSQWFYEVWVIRNCQYDRRQNTEKFFALLEKLEVVVSDKQKLLTTSCSYGCVPAVQFLAERGVDPNFQDQLGLRPLHYVVNATSDEKIEMARVLVELGADPHLASESGESAIEQGRRLLANSRNWPRMEAALNHGPRK